MICLKVIDDGRVIIYTNEGMKVEAIVTKEEALKLTKEYLKDE